MSSASSSSYKELDQGELISLLTAKDSELATQAREIERLQIYLANANRKMFGKKSERQTNDNQEELFSFETPPEQIEVPEVAVPAHTRKISRGRKPLPEALPRRREEHFPENMSCEFCGAPLKKIGEDITEELNYVPAHFEVVEHAKIKCACPSCKEGVVQGSLPPSVQPLAGARPGVGLLVFILISKFVDHLPLHRLEQIFGRQGIVIARQRMCDWLSGVMDYLEILWRLLKAETLSESYVQADETYIKVREFENEGQLTQGYLWGVHAPPAQVAFFEYFDTRSAEAAKEVLNGFRGAAQTDAYAGYNQVLLPDTVSRIACMAHIRRRFIEARALAPSECDRVTRQIAKLYALEAKWKECTPEARLVKRQKNARPELEKLFTMMEELQARLLPRHGLQEALSYAVKQRAQMFRYLEDGRYHLDNNAMERQIRPTALGRKNYLFAGSHEGAKRAAVFYSLLATCKLNKVNPVAWLTHVLKTMPSLPRHRYHELLPHRWNSSISKN